METGGSAQEGVPQDCLAGFQSLCIRTDTYYTDTILPLFRVPRSVSALDNRFLLRGERLGSVSERQSPESSFLCRETPRFLEKSSAQSSLTIIV